MSHRVSLSRLKLTDFRNYAELTLDLDSRHVVFCGDNGAGKTNLLEAISFLSPGRGLRRSAYADVPRIGSDAGFAVHVRLDGMQGEVEIGTGANLADDIPVRKLRIDGTQAKTVDDLLDHLRVLWLTPAMDGLFTGPASDRRRFLDRLVLSLDPAHGRRAADYERAMKGRNRLLSDQRQDVTWLTGLEIQMAELGIAMAQARHEMLGLLRRLVEETSGGAPFPSSVLTLSGFFDDQWHRPSADLEEDFVEVLRAGRGRDAAAGRTLDGPHRVDLLIRHRDKDIEAERCSTGEQKALLIGLVLAHARLVANMTNHAPLLLLDEIAAHLDEGRRAALFDLVDAMGGQAFMTGTDSAMFSALGERARFFHVSNGMVKE